MDKQTQRAMTLYLVVVFVAIAVFSAAAYAIGDKAGQMGGLVLAPLAAVPMLACWLANKQIPERRPLFGGLVWGGSWIFGAWLIGLLAGLASVVLAIGLGAMAFDPSMATMLEIAKNQALENGGEFPESAVGITRMVLAITSFTGPTIGVVFAAALGCLGTFPWLGWFGRRVLALGRGKALGSLLLLWAVAGIAGAFAPMPKGIDIGMSLPLRMAVNALMGACMALPMLWLFLRTRSAVVPAIFQASLQGAASLAMYYGADVNFMLAPPSGLLLAAVTLCAGIALWVWKDPGGETLAIRPGAPVAPADAAPVGAPG